MRLMALELPVGPSRLRASDADRERVVAFVRGHWSEGRLTDAELEQRLGRALQARTLGDLRKLVGDLPAPPQSGGRRVRRSTGYASRALKSVRVIVACVGVGLLGAVAVAVIFSSGASEEAPEVPPPAEKITRASVGQVRVDGGIAFQVRRIRGARSVRVSGGGELTPGVNRRFIIAEAQAVNRGSTPADPFCGSLGAELRVPAGEVIAPIEQLYRLEANDGVCSGGLEPGQRADYELVFRVPEGDRARHLDIWNSDEPGDLPGNTRIRIAA